MEEASGSEGGSVVQSLGHKTDRRRLTLVTWQESRLTAELNARDEELLAAHARIRKLEDTQHELVEAMSPISAVMKLDMDFSSVSAPGSSEREAFEKLFRQDVSRAAGISMDSISIQGMTPGSINVAMELRPDQGGGPDPHSAALDLKKQVLDPSSALRKASLTGAAVSVTVVDKRAMLDRVDALEKDLALQREELALAQAQIEQLNAKHTLEKEAAVAL
jgi:hypothetical protein